MIQMECVYLPDRKSQLRMKAKPRLHMKNATPDWLSSVLFKAVLSTFSGVTSLIDEKKFLKKLLSSVMEHQKESSVTETTVVLVKMAPRVRPGHAGNTWEKRRCHSATFDTGDPNGVASSAGARRVEPGGRGLDHGR